MADNEGKGVIAITYRDHDGDILIEHEYYSSFYTVEDILEDYKESGFEVLSYNYWA